MTYKKETYGHQLGPMTHFLTTPKFDLLLYIGEKCLDTIDLQCRTPYTLDSEPAVTCNGAE